MIITEMDKASASFKANLILWLMIENGIGRNESTKIALKLVARLIDYDPGTITKEQLEQEFEFICKDE